jgi:hypothetical protein
MSWISGLRIQPWGATPDTVEVSLGLLRFPVVDDSGIGRQDEQGAWWQARFLFSSLTGCESMCRGKVESSDFRRVTDMVIF